MGNLCNGQTGHQEIEHLELIRETTNYFMKQETMTNRFRHEVEKLKLAEDNKYRLILAVEGESVETKSIDCDILFSEADMEIYEAYNFKLQDLEKFPIMDSFEHKSENRQIYHKVALPNGERMLKYYNFKSFNDYELKRGLYEIHLHQLLGKSSALESYFIIYKGDKKQLVIIFTRYIASLHDIILYRKNTNSKWDDFEILVITKMILERYREMERLNIRHRDIRPSNIFLNPSAQEPGINNYYDLVNLESARICEDDEDDSQIITLKGIPAFTSGDVKRALLEGQQVLEYDPFDNDIQAIRCTVSAMYNLDPANGQTHTTQKGKIKDFIDFLEESDLTISKILDQIRSIVGSTKKIQNSLFKKDLTIAQNIEANLYFKSERNSQAVKEVYAKTLFELHKKDEFIPYMMEKLNKNYEEKNYEANVPILLQIGQYFEQSGSKENEYYREAIKTLLELAESDRFCGFYNEHSKYIQEAEQIYLKFKPDLRVNSQIRCLLAKEKAYQICHSQTYDEPLTHRQKGDIEKHMHEAMLNGQKSGLSLEEQLELIYARGELCLLLGKDEQSDTYFSQGSEICKNHREFNTRYQYNKYKGLFEYAEAILQIRNIQNNLLEKKAKTISRINEQLTRAKERFGMVEIHPIYLIKCYLGYGDLNSIKEDYSAAVNMYERALNLVHSENWKTYRTRTVSAAIELEIVEKLLIVLDQDDGNQAQLNQYTSLKEVLKKDAGRSRRSQKKYSKSGKERKQTKSERAQRKAKQGKKHEEPEHRLDVIQEEDEMHESKRMSLPNQRQEQRQQKIQSEVEEQEESNSQPKEE